MFIVYAKDSEVEIPRGAGVEQTKLHSEVEPEVFPSCVNEQSSKDGSKKLEEFMRNLKRDPEWARSIPFVKLNAMVPKGYHIFANEDQF
ncbi:hypothetical protein ANCCAN_06518 [Ancylostoma caninum]|uniref:Uncharacterized protein n=1 Tax=Ancylostoma caninum TaxID=29170 RepID=A0A368GST7_ANCCA|nr:hypothetical protein ANCCAN_06518 [Ancylostoma caninum]